MCLQCSLKYNVKVFFGVCLKLCKGECVYKLQTQEAANRFGMLETEFFVSIAKTVFDPCLKPLHTHPPPLEQECLV